MHEAKKTDWELVEIDFRAGIKTLRAIGADHGISHVSIHKRAKRGAWARGPKPTRTRPEKRPVPIAAPCAGFVYVLMADAGERVFYKIGMSVSFGDRLSNHQCSSPFELMVACCYFVGDMRAEERSLHELFASKRVRGEWFELSTQDLECIARRSLLV